MSSTINLYKERADDGWKNVVFEEMKALIHSTDEEIMKDASKLWQDIKSLAGSLRDASGRQIFSDPFNDRHDDRGSSVPRLYWRSVGRVGAFYHVENEGCQEREVIVLRMVEVSNHPKVKDARLARQRLATL